MDTSQESSDSTFGTKDFLDPNIDRTDSLSEELAPDDTVLLRKDEDENIALKLLRKHNRSSELC
ncbi:hypothetical protein N7540_010053 [Penicillium herquei]|nr:hypothetical protein N7540_010053 [Penicillium herquei]